MYTTQMIIGVQPYIRVTAKINKSLESQPKATPRQQTATEISSERPQSKKPRNPAISS